MLLTTSGQSIFNPLHSLFVTVFNLTTFAFSYLQKKIIQPLTLVKHLVIVLMRMPKASIKPITEPAVYFRKDLVENLLVMKNIL
jgi:hypothetical protein